MSIQEEKDQDIRYKSPELNLLKTARKIYNIFFSVSGDRRNGLLVSSYSWVLTDKDRNGAALLLFKLCV